MFTARDVFYSYKQEIKNAKQYAGPARELVGEQYTLFRSPVIPIYLKYKTINTKYFEIQEKQNTLYP